MVHYEAPGFEWSLGKSINTTNPMREAGSADVWVWALSSIEPPHSHYARCHLSSVQLVLYTCVSLREDSYLVRHWIVIII